MCKYEKYLQKCYIFTLAWSRLARMLWCHDILTSIFRSLKQSSYMTLVLVKLWTLILIYSSGTSHHWPLGYFQWLTAFYNVSSPRLSWIVCSEKIEFYPTCSVEKRDWKVLVVFLDLSLKSYLHVNDSVLFWVLKITTHTTCHLVSVSGGLENLLTSFSESTPN